jgi:hypothetical protein
MSTRLYILLILMIPSKSHSFNFSALKAFFSANKVFIKAKAKTTITTSSSGACHTSAEAQKELERGNIREFLTHPSTWVAGSAATGSTMLTNYFMKTNNCKIFLGRVPQFKHPRLKGTPELVLSLIIGVITFHSLHTPATVIQEELKTSSNDEE